MNPFRKVVFGSLGLLIGLIALLWWKPGQSGLKRDSKTQTPLLLYCAAGIKPAVEPVVREYEDRYGISVQIQYGGSGTLLGNLKVARRGDLYVAADSFFMELARSNQLVAEVIPLARLTPVVAVQKGNPKQIQTLADLERDDVQIVLANPDAAAVGSLVREHLKRSGRWDSLAEHARSFKPTVNDLANDVKLGSADAAIVWDATTRQYAELEMIRIPELEQAVSEVAIGVLQSTENPRAALHLARYLAARDRGLLAFESAGFTPVEGDVWADKPKVLLYSGGVNRPAIENTLREFEEREGVEVIRVYNGCGILTAQIRAGQRPDAYFACDISFMRTVGDMFLPSLNVAEADIVIAVLKGNPKNLTTIKDLTQPGLRLGVANEQQSALGALTARLLRDQGYLEGIMQNVVVQTPTADLLVNQLRTGALDAALVYEVNTRLASEAIDVFPLNLPGSTAIQPYAIGRDSSQQQLMERLLTTLRSAHSKERFESSGFRWLPDPSPNEL
jgi:molybdenum ABC transporter molybdate-binding protein